ncbi:MAG: saccharopine dehydrogenase family protein, partial [Alphaproteobacteria bacterium]
RHAVTAADCDAAAVGEMADRPGIAAMVLDVTDAAGLGEATRDVDMVVSALPGFLGFATLRTLIDCGVNVVDISFSAEDALELDGLAKAKGVVALTDMGVAPGLDHLILGHHDAQMEVRRFACLVGGLPQDPVLPWRYRAPFSPVDVIEEYVRPARMLRQGREVVMPALSEPELIAFDGLGELEAFNTDGLRSLLRTMRHVPDMGEKTLRYPGHRDLIAALRDSGFFSDEAVRGPAGPVIPLAATSAILIDQWQPQPGETDLTVMRVTVEGVEGDRTIRHVWHLHDVADVAGGVSSMARTTGYTCTAAVESVLSGAWAEPGVTPGELLGRNGRVFKDILAHLESRGVSLRHTSEVLA